MMENKRGEKQPEMVAEAAEGSDQLLAQGNGQILSYTPWVGCPFADHMEEEEKGLGSGPSVVQTLCGI